MIFLLNILTILRLFIFCFEIVNIFILTCYKIVLKIYIWIYKIVIFKPTITFV